MSHRQQSASGRKTEYVADRYRIEERLGRGGMAEVYRVSDEATKKEVALKILSEDASKKTHLSTLFEREFHTLAQLAHPRIIEVHDYGVDADRAYYTMELLDGADLRKLAPMEWRQACKLLCDVASSLALVHSRRLIHRDISSRNVRCTRDGRAKLIDFGAMSPFGTAARVIGTAAFVAPEALNHQPLDQRTDLYALGALAYWLMTRRYAYRAHYMSHLEDAWRTRPKPLSVLNPEIPKALNDLVMSLLSLDRMARPLFAAEVVETLSACAGFEPDDTVEVRQSYLAAPRLVGRAPMVADLLKRLIKTFEGRAGETLLLEGAGGVGRTRLLAEFVLQGKVLGATVLTTNADVSARGDYGVACELMEQLFESTYEVALEAIQPNLDVLCAAFPELAASVRARASNRTVETFGFDSLSTDASASSVDFTDSVERDVASRLPARPMGQGAEAVPTRQRIQRALLDLFLIVSQRRRLVIAVDDVQRADEPSAALLSALALESQHHPFILAVTVPKGRKPTAYAAFEVLSRVARRIELGALDREAVDELLMSIFGEAPNIGLLADRIYGIAKGNPRAAMQLAQHLVDRRVVCYRSGTWTIPTSIEAGDLPESLADAIRAKLQALSAGALALARTMALSTARHFSFEECLLLMERRDAALLTQELNELVSSDVLSTDGEYYALAQTGWAATLTEDMDGDSVCVAHVRLADLLRRRDGERFPVVQHLLAAWEHESALDLLIEHVEETLERFERRPEAFVEYVQSLPMGWLDTIKTGIGMCKRLGRPKRQGYLLRYLLVRSSSGIGLVGRDDLRVVVEQLRRDSGLEIYRELGDSPGARVAGHEDSHETRLSRALELAQERYDAADESERVFSPAEAIRKLAGATLAATSLASLSFDQSVLGSLPSLEPFFPLSPALRMLDQHAQATRCFTAGRYERARQKYLEILDIIAGPEGAGLDLAYREYVWSAFLYAVGLIEAVGMASALERADAIECHPLFQVNAWRIRMLYYLRQGDNEKAKQCERFLGLLQIQNSPSQLFEGVQLYPAITCYASCDDLTGVVQTMGNIEKMAECFEAWVPIAHYARGEYHRIRGDYSNALEELDEALRLTAAGRHSVWANAAGARLKTLFQLGRMQEARTVGREYLQAADKADLGFVCNWIRLPLALVEAKLGGEQRAERLADTAVEQWNDIGVTGVFLGQAYETRARVAVHTDDPKSFRKYASLCSAQYRAGLNPVLTAKHQKLIEDARQAYLGMSPDAEPASETQGSLFGDGDQVEDVHLQLAKCRADQDLFDRALALIVKRTGSSEGYLYLLMGGALRLAAQVAEQPPPERVVAETRQAFEMCMEEDGELDLSQTRTVSAEWQTVGTEDEVIERLLLSAEIEGRGVPVGAVILRLGNRSLFRLDGPLLDAVALSLFSRTRKDGDAEPDADAEGKPAGGESRYAIQALLGEGGMASVYKVRDRETGKAVALKRVRVEARGTPPMGPADLFERKKRLENNLRREYQMLKSLAHPRIVEVLDFGVDQQGAYYTMELLEEADLRQRAPVEWKTACDLLRDLASALALLHSRGLLHRDISPRNVRMTADNHVKLMDFGATVPMGWPKDRMGTPPFVPPEVIYRQRLDQRSDLYAFGALSYWLLTGRHAYRVRRVTELRDAWRNRPAPPSEVVARLGTLDEIPEPLDQLVMSLLSLDPLARPTSAAEVLERLSAIAGLPLDEQLAVPQSYVTTPTLVGRDEKVLDVRKRVIRSLRRRGGAILIQGAAGVGRSRFMDACVMEGKLAGMTVLKADARTATAGDYAVVQTLASQLFEEVPDVALEAAKPHLPLLRRIMPDLDSLAGGRPGGVAVGNDPDIEPPQQSETMRQLRPQIQEALRDWMLRVGKRRAVMLAVDDLHRIDEPSAAFLALLSHEISGHMLLVVATVSTTDPLPPTVAIHLVREAATVVEMADLSLEETRKLLGSLFGQAPNVRLLSDRLYAISQGNPRTIMQLAQHLIDTQVIRYQAGAWTLPDSLDADDLPTSLKDALKARLRRIEPAALRLAQAMALSPDQRFSYEECLLLTERRDADRLARHIDELLALEIISTDGKHYAPSRRGWVSVLTEGLDETAQREIHLRLAELFDTRGGQQFRVGYHLVHAGEEGRAIDALVHFSEESKKVTRQNTEAFDQLFRSLPPDWFETFRSAIALAKRRNRPRRDVFNLQGRLLGIGVLTGTIDRAHMAELFQQLCSDSGLDFYGELGDSVDERERIQRAIELAQQRYDSIAESERVLPPLEAIRDLAMALIEAVGPAFISGDYEFWQSLPSLKPLVALSPALGLVEKLVRAVGDGIAGRFEQNCQKNREIVERLDQPDRAGLEGAHYQYFRYGIIYALGIREAILGLESALKWASEIESSSLLQVNVWRIRKLHYLWQGAAAEAEACQAQVEMLQVQNSPSTSWRGTHLRPELRAYCCAEDLSGIKQIMDEIEKMASDYACWIPIRCYARGEYHRIRGDHASALGELQEALRLTSPGRHQAWAEIAGAYLQTLLALDREREAREVGREFLHAAEREDLGYTCNYVQMPLAIAEAKLGDTQAAVENAEAAIERIGKLGATGLHLTLAYETRARVAIHLKDEETYLRYAHLCAEQYRATGNPCLVAKYERLIQEAREAELDVPSMADETVVEDDDREGDDIYRQVRAELGRCRGAHNCAERALEILIQHYGAKGGYLFGMQPGGLQMLSSHGAASEPANLLGMAGTYLEAELEDSPEATVTEADAAAAEGNSTGVVLDDGTPLQFILIHGIGPDGPVVAGVAALIAADGELRKASPELVRAVSDVLFETGDVAPRCAVQ